MALAGASPEAVTRTLGQPQGVRGASASGASSVARQRFVVNGGRVTVTYCGGAAPDSERKAASFELRYDRPLPTAAALLGRTGLPPGQVQVVMESPSHVELGPRPGSKLAELLVRAQARRVEDGWQTVVVDFAVRC